MTLRQPGDTQAEFERAFVATSYVLGRRGQELGEPLGPLSAPTRQLIGGLSLPEQQARAEVLAAEVAGIAQALERRRIL